MKILVLLLKSPFSEENIHPRRSWQSPLNASPSSWITSFANRFMLILRKMTDIVKN